MASATSPNSLSLSLLLLLFLSSLSILPRGVISTPPRRPPVRPPLPSRLLKHFHRPTSRPPRRLQTSCGGVRGMASMAKKSVGDLTAADLKAAIPTIKHLIGNGARVILSSHLGRPKGVTPKYNLKPLVPRLSELLGVRVEKADDCIGPEVETMVAGLPEGGVLFLEYVRFYKEEEKNEPEFAKKLDSLADLYVNDAFGTAQRAHASTEVNPGVEAYTSLHLLGTRICSSFTASTISFPLEVARKRLMVGSLQGKCPPHMAAVLAEVIQEEGLRGLYREWGAGCLKVMPSSCITRMFYEAWKDILLVGKQPF
ncbi:phosphoglycerate kinase, chloroplastic [Cinnamomum micranthum f. kanehirae]|uniref:Phosphoglycerate kinase n=1 Tax=Cinnamomum micranthum f. kanehirae TaxID=337451 RepID=A0A3S3MX88_9MAGN|nr:phosphoglycerate kinase, chloroplastic [Cinnamomum micranthum f. kanehirae]